MIMNLDRSKTTTIAYLVLIIFFISCEDNQYPEDIWDPDDQGLPTPIITSIDPPDSAFSGADEITITGQYFNQDKTNNLVYFNSELAEILQASETVLVISPPAILGDSITIKVAAVGSFLFAVYDNYKLVPRMIKYGEFDAIEESAWGLEADADENLYVGLSIFPEGSIDKLIPPSGDRINDFIHALLATPLSLKIGPDSNMYYVDGANPYIIRQEISTGAPGYNTLPSVSIDLDFDQHGNLYCGGIGGEIYCVKSDMTNSTVADYEGISIKALRVHDNQLYVAGNYSGDDPELPDVGIWRNQILSADGELGEKELILDWTTQTASLSSITGLTFDENGLLYISADSDVGIAVLGAEGSLEPLYPKIIKPPITKMTWGSRNYLYLNYRGDKRAIYRLDIGITGAPYHGRPGS